MYANEGDEDSLSLLADESKRVDRVEALKIYREQAKTQELIKFATGKFRSCVEKLTNPNEAQKMTDTERAYTFAAMDWARYTLDIVGEDPNQLESQVDEIVLNLVRRAGIAE